MNKTLNNSWDNILKDEFEKPYFKALEERIDKEYNSSICFPEKDNIFDAFRYTDYKDIKVVILGQDPYHNDGEAMGLCFSVPENIKLPPSLKNIYQELASDTDCVKPKSGDLSAWTKEGVFLLNTTLTVRKNQPLSHKGLGWETFTDEIIRIINRKTTPVVFILWGSNARSKKPLINDKFHYIIESAHPSPLSAYNGFFGSKPFSRANKFLMEHEIEPIDWSVIE